MLIVAPPALNSALCEQKFSDACDAHCLKVEAEVYDIHELLISPVFFHIDDPGYRRNCVRFHLHIVLLRIFLLSSCRGAHFTVRCAFVILP